MSWSIATPGISHADSSQLTLTLEYIKKSPNMAMFYQYMDGLTMHVGANVDTIALPQSGQIMWNPYQGLQVISADGILGVQSAAMGLFMKLRTLFLVTMKHKRPRSKHV